MNNEAMQAILSEAPKKVTTCSFDREKHVDASTNKNTVSLHCPACCEIVFKPQCCTYNATATHKIVSLDGSLAELKGMWTVNDMFAFENVTFHRDSTHGRFLTCASCESDGFGLVVAPVHFVSKDRMAYKSA